VYIDGCIFLRPDHGDPSSVIIIIIIVIIIIIIIINIITEKNELWRL